MASSRRSMRPSSSSPPSVEEVIARQLAACVGEGKRYASEEIFRRVFGDVCESLGEKPFPLENVDAGGLTPRQVAIVDAMLDIGGGFQADAQKAYLEKHGEKSLKRASEGNSTRGRVDDVVESALAKVRLEEEEKEKQRRADDAPAGDELEGEPGPPKPRRPAPPKPHAAANVRAANAEAKQPHGARPPPALEPPTVRAAAPLTRSPSILPPQEPVLLGGARSAPQEEKPGHAERPSILPSTSDDDITIEELNNLVRRMKDPDVIAKVMGEYPETSMAYQAAVRLGGKPPEQEVLQKAEALPPQGEGNVKSVAAAPPGERVTARRIKKPNPPPMIE